MQGMHTRDRIRGHLRRGDWVSGEGISATLGISRAAVSKHIAALRAGGCRIESAPRKGYRLVAEPDLLTREEVAPHLHAQCVGANWHYEPSVVSTNALARDAAFAGAPEGGVYVADAQTGGRGRRGREWVSPPGCGIYASVLLRPRLAPDALPLLTLVAAVAVARAIRQAGAGEARIKWPNDVLVAGCKVCGILTEMVADAEALTCVIIGIGLNVNTPVALLPSRPLFPASSLAALSGHPISRAKLLGFLLSELDSGYHELCSNGPDGLIATWENLSDVVGRQILVRRVQDEICGVAEGLDRSGALIVRDPAGSRQLILSGDVSYL